jgi:hypothetical protein
MASEGGAEGANTRTWVHERPAALADEDLGCDAAFVVDKLAAYVLEVVDFVPAQDALITDHGPRTPASLQCTLIEKLAPRTELDGLTMSAEGDDVLKVGMVFNFTWREDPRVRSIVVTPTDELRTAMGRTRVGQRIVGQSVTVGGLVTGAGLGSPAGIKLSNFVPDCDGFQLLCLNKTEFSKAERASLAPRRLIDKDKRTALFGEYGYTTDMERVRKELMEAPDKRPSWAPAMDFRSKIKDLAATTNKLDLLFKLDVQLYDPDQLSFKHFLPRSTQYTESTQTRAQLSIAMENGDCGLVYSFNDLFADASRPIRQRIEGGDLKYWEHHLLRYAADLVLSKFATACNSRDLTELERWRDRPLEAGPTLYKALLKEHFSIERLRTDRFDWTSLNEARLEGREMKRCSTNVMDAQAVLVPAVGKRKFQQEGDGVAAIPQQGMCSAHARFQLDGKESDGRKAGECGEIRCDYIHYNLLAAGKVEAPKLIAAHASYKAKAGLLKLAKDFAAWPT